MFPAPIPWLIGILGAIVLAGILIAWPEIRGFCPACAPVGVTGISSSQFVRVRHASEIDDAFARQIDTAGFLTGNIPRIFVQDLPNDLSRIVDVERRKQLFAQVVLPQVLRLNESVRADRARLAAIGQTSTSDRPSADAAWLVALARQYRADPADYASLLARVDIVPPSLAIAQGAIESGWGTSRFAVAGNALFGQRTFDPSRAGFRPKDVENADFKVRRFESLMRSIWAYMITLNSHPAHAEFRQLRSQMRQRGDALNSIALAGTLTRYSEEGEAYTNLVQSVISANNFRTLDDLRLTDAP
jgi:Bax protein